MLSTLLVVSGMTLAPRKAEAADPTVVEFTYAGTAQSWTVPAGVSSIQVDAWGAQGGNTDYGGPGAHIRATIAVTPGETLQVNVGGQPAANVGGFNGGGGGGGGGSGGGGASDVRQGGVAIGNRVVVAGGGGGAGQRASTTRGPGGSGGTLVGGTGEMGTSCSPMGGEGGTQSAGGAGGVGSTNGATGTLGAGGNGANTGTDGGGGGGGYYGGGGGAGCGASTTPIGGGGGGGSSYASSAASDVSREKGVRRGHGLVRITYPPDSPTPPSAPNGSQTFSYTGGPQWWVVPDGVTAVRVEAWGAQGAGADYGGLGGYIEATIPVTAGHPLQIDVGGQAAGVTGGFNGGGKGGSGGGGGGGASDVRKGGVTLADRVLVAGGGGGAGEHFTSTRGPGGSGGGQVGGTGEIGTSCSPTGGEGGTQSAGGAGGIGSTNGAVGESGVGGAGAGSGTDGGAGGGGLYGGGGGAGCGASTTPIGGGGGGGSSYASQAATGVEHQQAVRRGDGLVKITYPPALPPAPSTPASGSASFSFTGGAQWWTVPAGVRAVRVTLEGAQGGSSFGGLGGSVEAVLLTTPGEPLQVNVGGQPAATEGGFNGGAPAGGTYETRNAWGGGGASDVRRGGVTLAQRALVAGGGGGGGEAVTSEAGAGGAGGGLLGGAGQDGTWCSPTGGGGGTQSVGGAGGVGAFIGTVGALGEGGKGANAGTWTAGGGGGGGLYGGGGGGGCNADAIPIGGGGGGGSSSADETKAFDAFTTPGANSGNGSATITWPETLPADRALGHDSYGEYVNKVHLGSGNFVETVTDVEIATAGPDLEVTRTYNSLDTKVGIFGKGWTSSYEIRANEDIGSGDVTIIYPDGRRERHTSEGGGAYKAPKSYVSTLTEETGGGWRLTHKDKTVHVFDSTGRLTSIEDAYGRDLDLTYTDGKLTEVQDGPSVRRLRFTYDGDRVESVTTNSVTGPGYDGPLTWNYVYSGDLLTKVCEARDPNTVTGNCTNYTYTSDRLTKITRPEGNEAIRLSYGSDGKVDWSENGTGDRASFTYGSGITQITDPRGFVTSYFFDPIYRTVRLIDPLGALTLYGYDSKGFRSSVTDPNGNKVKMTHDDRGNVLSQTNAESETTWFTYDGDDMVTRRDGRSSSSSDDTYKTVFTYNSKGDLLTEKSPPTSEHPSGITKTTTYTDSNDDFGWGTVPAGLKKTESPGKGTISYQYDADGDLRRRIDPSGLTTEFSHDALGRVISTKVEWEDGSATATTAYDQLGNVVEETEPAVTNTAEEPDVIHRRQMTYEYDDNARRTKVTVADIGGAASPTPTRETVYEYDDADRLTTITDPESGVTLREFDPNGNVKKATDAEGRVFETDYDTANRPTEVRLLGFVDDPIAGSAARDVVLKRYRYDTGGRKIAEVDPQPGTGGLDGQDTPGAMQERWFDYDDADRLLSVTQKGFDNRAGVSPATRDIVLEEYVYDDAGNATTEKSGDGLRTITNVFDEAGRLQSSTLETGSVDRVTEYDYEELGNATRTATRASDASTPTAETRAVYDDAGRMTSQTVENGSTDLQTTYSYDDRGLRTRMVDPRGNLAGADPDDFRTDYAYDDLGRPTTTTSPPVSVEEEGGAAEIERPVVKIGYDAVGNQETRVDARGAVTRMEYDRLDRLTRIEHPTYNPPGPALEITPDEEYTYDKVGNLTSVKDRRDQLTDFDFDARNRVVRRLDALVVGEAARGAMRFEYDDAGNRTAIVDQTGARVKLAYDDLGRVRTQSQIVRQDAPSGTFDTTFDYDDLGNGTFTRDPENVTVTRAFNGASELTSITDAVGETTMYRYDAAGRQISVEDPLGRATELVYDLAGRRISTEYRDGVGGTLLAREFADYDAAGNQTAFRSARSASSADDTFKTSYEHDALNRLTQVTEPVDADTEFETGYGYDAAGNLTRVTDGRENVTVHTWNPWNLRQSTIEPSTLGQDAAADRTFTTRYDAGGLPVEETVPGVSLPVIGGSPITITRTFDEPGRLTSESGSGTGVSSATRAFGYDLAGRQTSWSHPSGDIGAAYDDRGLLLSTTAPGGASTASSFRYDDASRMTRRTDAAGESDFTYTGRGELDTIEDPLTGRALDYAWNDAGQPSGIAYSGVSAARTYTYDSRGRLQSDTLADGATTLHATTYLYDDEGNLIEQDVTAPGNPAEGEHTYAYDRGGRLASWDSPAAPVVAYEYDGAGNRTRAGDTESTYDERNRLTRAGTDIYTWTARGTLATAQRTGVPTTVEHDALGRLIAWGDTEFTYDALDRIATREGQSFTYAGREIDPVAHGSNSYGRTPAGELTSLEVGTTAALAGENRHGDLAWLASPAGAVTDTRVWDPYGNVAGETGATDPAVGFQADYTDPASGLVWMGARHYDPASAIFTARDQVFGQLRTPITLNRYTYANADPLEFFDPDGRWGCGIFGKICSWVNENIVQPVYNYVIKPVIHAVSSAVHALGSAAATVGRTVGRWGRSAGRAARRVVQRITSVGRTALKAIRTSPLRKALHSGLNLVGLLPGVGEIADLASCGLHALAGERGDAALSCAAAVPFLGWGAAGIKGARSAFRAAEGAGDLYQGARAVDRVEDALSGARAATRADDLATAGRAFEAAEDVGRVTRTTSRVGVPRRPTLRGVDAPRAPPRPGALVGASRAPQTSLPKLTGTVRESFAGSEYAEVTFRAGQRFHRAEAWSASRPGRFLGLQKADTALEAESAYNLAKWGNPAEVMRSYELTEDVTMYLGRVAGGEGYQALIPRGIEPESILRFVGARPL